MTPMFPLSYPNFFPTSPNIFPASRHISLCSFHVFRCLYLHPIYPNVTQHPQIPHESTYTIISPMSPIFSLYPIYTTCPFSPCISSQCTHVSCIFIYFHHHTLSLCYNLYPLCPLYVSMSPIHPLVHPIYLPIYSHIPLQFTKNLSHHIPSFPVLLVLLVSNVSPCPMYHSPPLHVPHKHVHTCRYITVMCPL